MLTNLWRRLTGSPQPATPAASVSAPAGAPAAEPAAAPAPIERARPGVATVESLHRSLNWRARVLMDGATRESLASDGPELVDSLRKANESVIRQPPAAAMQALRIARNADSSIQQVTALFENDPMLAQALLRQANSVFYRRDDTPTTSLQAGVQRVGSQGTQGILMASMVQTMLCRPGGAFDPLVQKVWSHMQRTAPISRALAPAFGLDPESLYSLALLHDVGKLVVFDHLSTLRHDKHRELKVPERFLSQLLGHLHESLGGLAVLSWGMGGEAAHAIGEHHRRPAPDRPDPVTECLYVAEVVELAHTNFTRLDWEQTWTDGAITADVAAVQDRLRHLEE